MGLEEPFDTQQLLVINASCVVPVVTIPAAGYACNRWHNISSVTEMVGHLGWEPLNTRRRNMRLCMMYKIAHTVVGDPRTEWMPTTKRVTRGFHAWKYIPIYSQHNIYKFSFLPRTISGVTRGGGMAPKLLVNVFFCAMNLCCYVL